MDAENMTIQNESEKETPLYESTYVLTETEYKKLIIAVRPYGKLFISWALIVAGCCYMTKATTDSTESMIITLVMTILLIPAVLFASFRRGLKNFRQDKSLYNSEHHLKFYSDKLVTETARGTRITPYNELYKVKEKKNYFYLYISKNRFLPIIKEYCSEELMEFIRNIKH